MMAYEDSFAFKLLQKFESLRERVQNYIAVVDLCPLPAFITSRDGTAILYLNAAYKKMLGVTEENLQNLDWLQVVYKPDQEMVKAVWANFLASAVSDVTMTSKHRYVNNTTGLVIPAITYTTAVAYNGIVGYIVPSDCLIMMVLGIDLQCEVQKSKMKVAAGAGYDPASS